MSVAGGAIRGHVVPAPSTRSRSPPRGPRSRLVRTMPPVIATGFTAVLLATGAGVLAIVVVGIAIVASLGGEDRGKLAELARHPLRTIFAEDQPDDDED